MRVRIASRSGSDAEGRQWLPNVRPVSVGDVVYVARAEVNKDGAIKGWQEEGYFSIDHAGFTQLERNPGCSYGLTHMSAARTVALAA